MATYRNIQMSFWTDSKVLDEFTAEDRLFYLYLLTNPHTSICGCYEISIRQMAFEIGAETEDCLREINRLQDDLDVIRYDPETKEVLIPKWYRHNWTSSEKFRTSLHFAIEDVKSEIFKAYLYDLCNGIDDVSIPTAYGMHTVSIPMADGMDTTVTVTVTDTVTDTVTVSEIIDHLNEKCGTRYKATSEKTKALIRARMNEHFTVQDFFTVIDKKAEEWIGDPKMRAYLRPETLFGTKFEGYLNAPKAETIPKHGFKGRDYDFDKIEEAMYG